MYILNETTRYNKCFKFDLEGTTDQNSKIKRIVLSDSTRLIYKTKPFFWDYN